MSVAFRALFPVIDNMKVGRNLHICMCALVFPLPTAAQESGKFDLMIDYQPLSISNISAHTGAFVHAAPFLPFDPRDSTAGGVRIGFALGMDHTYYSDGSYAATLFWKMGGYWSESNASYLVYAGTLDGSQPFHGGFEHQWRFFARRHFSCHASGQVFLPYPQLHTTYKAYRYAAAGIVLRLF